MELEDQETQKLLNQIILWEGKIIEAHNEYMGRKSTCEYQIKSTFEQIAQLRRRALLKKQGREWSYPADCNCCREESEKELQRWKNLSPGEKIKGHKEKINEPDEDWEPMTDIQVDRQIEVEFEKELESLQKAHEECQRNYEEKMKSLRGKN